MNNYKKGRGENEKKDLLNPHRWHNRYGEK